MIRAIPALLLVIAGRAYFGVLTSDDAFITYRYARNLLSSHAFVYNTGERVLGTSTPLYGAIITVLMALHLPVEAASVTFGAACDAGIAIVLYRLLADAGFARAGAAGAAFAAVVPAAMAPTMNGMETPLYGLLILLTVRAAARAVDTGETGAAAAFAIALGLCRPDGALAVSIATAGLILRRPRAAWRLIIVVSAAAAVAMIAAVAYYGTFVPQSVRAKAALDRPPLAGLSLLAQLLIERWHFVPTAFAVIGAVVVCRRSLACRWLVIWWVVYATAFSLSGGFARGYWYFVPLLPMYWGTAAVGLDVTLTRAFGTRAASVALAVMAVGIVAGAIYEWPRHRAMLRQDHQLREEPYLAIGRQIAGSDRPCNVAATEIGAIGYAFPGRIIDLGGLTTPAAVGRPAERVLQDLDAQWLVTQNIYMPAGLAAAPSFAATFELVQSIPLVRGRSTDVYKRRGGACRPD